MRTRERMALARVSVVSTLLLASCNHTMKEGEKIVLGDGDSVDVGSVHIDVTSRDDALLIRMHEGQRQDQRLVTGARLVKFGAHRVWFDEKGSSVAVVVRPYRPASPLTSSDALLAADEAMSSKSTGGPVDCTEALLSPDGNTFVVRCHDSDHIDPQWTVKVDVVTGAAL